MCTQHASNKKKGLNSFALYTLAIVLGIFSGLSDISFLQNFGLLISDIFIKIFKCISLPLIALSIIVTLCGYKSEDGMKAIWQRTLFYTLSTTVVAATISCVLYLLINPANINLLGENTVATPADNQVSYFLPSWNTKLWGCY